MQTLTKETMEVRLPSSPEFVAAARLLVGSFALLANLPESAVEDVKVAVSEACANAIRHAYRDCPDGMEEVLIRCTADDLSMTTEIVDNGPGFDAAATESNRRRRKRYRDNGFGMILMRNCMDDIQYIPNGSCGTIVRMTKRVPSEDLRSDILS